VIIINKSFGLLIYKKYKKNNNTKKMATRQSINFGTGGNGGSGGGGATGLTGATGLSIGPIGPQGPAGTNGTNGINGSTGATGLSVIGATGAKGATGISVVGATGPIGATGLTATSSNWSTFTATSDVNVPSQYSVIVGNADSSSISVYDGVLANTSNPASNFYSSIGLSNVTRNNLWYSYNQGIRLSPSAGVSQLANSEKSAVVIGTGIAPTTSTSITVSRLIVDCITNTNKVLPTNGQILSWGPLTVSGSANNGDGQLKWINPLTFDVRKGTITLNSVVAGNASLGYGDVGLSPVYTNTSYNIQLSPSGNGTTTITNYPRVESLSPNEPKVSGFRVYGDIGTTIYWSTFL
jgi:hypothetical protein